MSCADYMRNLSLACADLPKQLLHENGTVLHGRTVKPKTSLRM